MSVRVGIIGGGTAGSAAAILLARGGATVTVLERVVDPGPVGAGIIVQPTGQHVTPGSTRAVWCSDSNRTPRASSPASR